MLWLCCLEKNNRHWFYIFLGIFRIIKSELYLNVLLKVYITWQNCKYCFLNISVKSSRKSSESHCGHLSLSDLTLWEAAKLSKVLTQWLDWESKDRLRAVCESLSHRKILWKYQYKCWYSVFKRKILKFFRHVWLIICYYSCCYYLPRPFIAALPLNLSDFFFPPIVLVPTFMANVLNKDWMGSWEH